MRGTKNDETIGLMKRRRTELGRLHCCQRLDGVVGGCESSPWRRETFGTVGN